MTVCVFCGARDGKKRFFLESARRFGTILGERGHSLIYGGGNVGLMGAVADAAMEAGALATGVIPKHLVDREIAHGGLDQLEMVGTMHERKARMHQLSDAFVALPGGIGTLEELTEVISWNQLSLLRHPVGLLNVDGYWNPFVSMLSEMAELGMTSPAAYQDLVVKDDPDELLVRLEERVRP